MIDKKEKKNINPDLEDTILGLILIIIFVVTRVAHVTMSDKNSIFTLSLCVLYLNNKYVVGI